MGTWDCGPFDSHPAVELLSAPRTGTFRFVDFRRSCVPVGEAASESWCMDGEELRTPQARAWLRKRVDAATFPVRSERDAVWEATGEV